MARPLWKNSSENRHSFIGGSDARIIMGADEDALLQLWREKRGQAEPVDLSGNLIVQLGAATEELNRHWYEGNTGQIIMDVQKHVRHPVLGWLGATLDGRVQASEAVLETKFMLPWSFSEEARLRRFDAEQGRGIAVLRQSGVVDMNTSNAWAECAGVFHSHEEGALRAREGQSRA
jgi:hypothetical protein